MENQLPYEMEVSGIVGIVLFSCSIAITWNIIKLVPKRKVKLAWVFIGSLIACFLAGYATTTVFAFLNNSAGITSIASIIYLLGSVFVIVIIHSCYETIRVQRREEDELIQAKFDLERRANEGAVLLQKSHEALQNQERFAAIGKLAGSLSHELRHPLGIITNSAYYLNLKLQSPDAKVHKHLQILQEQSDKANKIISDFLDFARARPETAELVSIPEAIKDVLDLVSPPETIELRVEVREPMPKISIDPRKLRQAFQNIITNAYQAMSGGGQLSISAAAREGMVDISFRDTGIGIPEENLRRIFEPLFTTKMRGAGLGLALTKDVVERYGGNITVSSKVGEGTTITISIPTAEKQDVIDTLTRSFW